MKLCETNNQATWKSFFFKSICIFFLYFLLGSKFTNFSKFCSKISHYFGEVSEGLNQQLHNCDLEKIHNLEYQNFKINSEKIHMYSEKLTNSFHMKREKRYLIIL